MLIFLIIILAIFIAAAAIVIVYFFYYTFRINKQLKNPQGEGKHMPSPAVFAGIALIVVLFVGQLAFIVFYPWDQGTVPPLTDQYEEQYDLKIYTPQEMDDSYLRQFSPESNKGYEKYEEVVNDIRFTYFISQEPYDTLHPNFIIYVEYIGAKDVLTYGLNGVFYTLEDFPLNDVPMFKGLAGKDISESDAEDYLCVAGNTSVSCSFTLSVYYHDTEEAPYNPDMPDLIRKNSDNAVAAGYILLEFNQ